MMGDGNRTRSTRVILNIVAVVRAFIRRHRRWGYAPAMAMAVAASLWIYASAAPFDPPETRLTTPGTVVLDAQGIVLQRDGGDGFRIPIALNDVAPIMLEATVAAEDQRFYSHPGVDPIAAARALFGIHSGRSGASTITQQLARRLYLADGGGPLPVRKARESLIALQLEAHRSKDEILALYLNEIYYGRGAYGIEAAARVYFGVSAANLDLARAAYLAGLPQLPSSYAGPGEELGRERQSYVLSRLVDDGKVSSAVADAARSEPLALLPVLEPAIGRQFVAFAMEELAALRPDIAGQRGLVIETTLDSGLQLESERLARLQLDELRDRNVTNAAVVVLEPQTGAILAMAGSVEGEINLAVAARQPGSALKPFLYAEALERGYTAASPLLDVPTTFVDGDERYTPLDYDRRFRGVVPLRTALASSLNVPAVAMLESLGIDSFLETAHGFGLTTLTESERYGLALTLGGGEVRLIDLTGAYAALAAGGELARPYAVARVRDSAGRVLYERPPVERSRATTPQVAYLVSDMLSDADARIPGFGQVTPFDLPFKAAVKTGTTTGFKDNWALGYTENVAAGVWVGNADASPMVNVSGVDGAGPLWRDVMMAATATRTPAWPARPPGIVERTVCAPTGLLPGADCPSPVLELFLSGTVPAEKERYYVRLADGELAIAPPPEARAWAIDAGFTVADGATAGRGLRIVAPVQGGTLYIAPELRAQEMLIRATAPNGASTITFHVDGQPAGTAPGTDARVTYGLTVGPHEIEAVAHYDDGTIESATINFEVRAK